MLDLIAETTHYPVEVSGWDAQQNFFVENTTLEWSETNGRAVLVRSPLLHGALVFVRLAGPLQTAYPLPYRVKSVQARGSRGLQRVHLEQMRSDERVVVEEPVFGVG